MDVESLLRPHSASASNNASTTSVVIDEIEKSESQITLPGAFVDNGVDYAG